MRANEIVKQTRTEPFRPFRIFISDGAAYDVRHPEMILVTQTQIAIALPAKGEDVPFEMAYCDPVHVTRIEYIAGNGAKSSRRSKR